MLLDRDKLLLADEPMPAAERLGVGLRIGVVGGMSRRITPAVWRAISSPVRKRFCSTMRAASAGSIELHEAPRSAIAVARRCVSR
jgi:hypothetical protein